MMSAPYPSPALASHTAARVVGWLAGAGAGLWVIVSPPVSYEGIGVLLTTMWGVMLGAGSILAAAGHALRRYRVELPGLVLALGGISIYSYLSWEAVFTGSPGSGPRAFLLILLAAHVVARVRELLWVDERARQLAALREGGAHE